MAVFQLPLSDYKSGIAAQLAQSADPAPFDPTALLPTTPTTTTPPLVTPTTTAPTRGATAIDTSGPSPEGGLSGALDRRRQGGSSRRSQADSLSSVPQVSREDYMTEGDPGVGDYIGHLFRNSGQPVWKDGAVKGKQRLDEAGTAKYIDAKINRVLTIANLAGYSPDEQQALRDQITYQMGQVADSGDQEANLAAWEQIINEVEAPLASEVIATTANGGKPVKEDTPGVYSPEQIAAIQASIGQFMSPLIEQQQQSSAAGADVLREFAAGQGSPALARLVNAQAAQMQASGDALATAYMRQAQSLPAIQALEGQQAMAQQIMSLQNQLAQYQAGASGGGTQLTPDLVAQLTGGG